MYRLSIILVTYNSSKHIFDCLQSIYKYNDIGDDVEVIVVDNNSNERLEMFKAISHLYGDKVKLIDSGKNGGYGYGNNIGIKAASAPIVIVVNPDVRFIYPVFKTIISIMQKPKVGMVGGSFSDGSVPYYFKIESYSVWHELFNRYYIKKKQYNSKKMYLSGCFLVFNKKAFNDAGAFDENLFMYCEEADITNRMLNNNYLVEWHPEVLVYHTPHGSTFNKELAKILYESQIYYCDKYKLSVKRFFKQKINVLRIKKILSLVLLNKKHYVLFKENLQNLCAFYKRMYRDE